MRLAIPSLRLRLVLVMGLAYVVVAATTLFTGYTVQQQSLHGQLVARAKSDAAILAAGAVGFGTGLSLGPLRTFLSSLEHRTQGVSYAAVTDSSGKVIASTNPHSRHRRLAVSLPRRPTSIVLKGGGVEGIAPIVQPGGTALGLAVVRLGGQSIASDLRNSLLLEAATQLLGLAIFLVLSLIISQYILGPLLALSRAASSLRRGDLGARVRQRGGTELTAVAEAFNDMASALEQRIKHLSFLAQTGSALPNALRYRGDIHPILQDFCRQIPARVAGLMFTDEDRAIWHAASPNPHYQEVAGAVAAQAKDATALVQDEVSVMVVPVMGGAVFAVAREAEAPFTGEEQQVVTNFANQIGIAADNARLFESQQEALRVKDQFLSIVSHELRTPLTTIKGYAQMLRHGQVQEIEAARFAETIDAQASRLGRLVDDLLDVTRFTRGQFELERQPGDIRPVVE
ncbi:MAG: histidine kinase dimerization/phospho-acceptor domain-containing protein, partial [Chloroflexota bacterium]